VIVLRKWYGHWLLGTTSRQEEEVEAYTAQPRLATLV
jgi:hypothetical protein